MERHGGPRHTEFTAKNEGMTMPVKLLAAKYSLTRHVALCLNALAATAETTLTLQVEQIFDDRFNKLLPNNP